MPTYRYNPDIKNNKGFFISTFEVYDPIQKKKINKKINRGETFITDTYLSNNVMKNEEYEFVSDEPYFSPILLNYTGNESNVIEVPEIGCLVDIYVSVMNNSSNNSYIELFFNDNNKDKVIVTPYSSGTIFRCISNSKIRCINTVPYNDAVYTVSVLDAEQFATNNSLNVY